MGERIFVLFRDENGIEFFKIRQTNQLVDGRVIKNV